MEKAKNKTPQTGGKKYNQTHLIEDKIKMNTLAAKGAKNNDELNDDKNNAKKRKGASLQNSLWEQPKAKKANLNNNPH